MDNIYHLKLKGNSCWLFSNVITVVACCVVSKSLFVRGPFPIQANGEYPLLNGDWNMGAACLGNHLMSTCQRYQGGTKSKTTGLSNQKRHRGNRFLRNLQAMKRISGGFDRDFIWHRSCLQINPTTKLWFPFIPKVPFPWLQCRGIWGGWSEVKQREEGT